MNTEQLSIFELLDKYRINKPIRLIELFAGVGAQHKALTNIKARFESYRICEWALPSIIGYNAIHVNNFGGIWNCCDKKTVVRYLLNKGISLDYNNLATEKQLLNTDINLLRQCANSIDNTNNVVNICNIRGWDLKIVDKENYCYIMTYSYPCQDLSTAGKHKGQKKGSGTRSALLWEVGRILKELSQENGLPQVLLMENVTNCHGGNNVKEFVTWLLTLEQLGYQNFVQDLNSKDFGIPQSRNRCYMISILNPVRPLAYTFPKKEKLILRLNDLLEKNVKDKYFISEKMIMGMCKTNFQSYNINHLLQDRGGICSTLIARYEGNPLIIPECIGGFGNKCNNNRQFHYQNRIYRDNLACALTTKINPYYYIDMKLRKLTPLECFRLMGFSDEDYCKASLYLSDSQLYHIMGDSIVVKVLEAIFKKLITGVD